MELKLFELNSDLLLALDGTRLRFGNRGARVWEE
jgi:hypothetical protein